MHFGRDISNDSSSNSSEGSSRKFSMNVSNNSFANFSSIAPALPLLGLLHKFFQESIRKEGSFGLGFSRNSSKYSSNLRKLLKGIFSRILRGNLLRIHLRICLCNLLKILSGFLLKIPPGILPRVFCKNSFNGFIRNSFN